MKRRLLLGISLAILSLSISSCATKQTIEVSPEYPSLPKIEDTVSKDTLEAIRKPLDLIPEPKTVADILYNMAEFRTGYINWRRYATALEEYYNEVARIIGSDKEEK